jgi:hypothetical protein
MKRLFKRDMNERELNMYNQVIKEIKKTNQDLIKKIDDNIACYQTNYLETIFFLGNMTLDQKIEYFKKLKMRLVLMEDCDKIKVKVANPLHPMCWAYHLTNFFSKRKDEKKKQFFNNLTMYGFCVPFYIHRPIMIAHYVFEKGRQELKEILVHELTHSLMYTKDILAENSDDAINDAWTIYQLYL